MNRSLTLFSQRSSYFFGKNNKRLMTTFDNKFSDLEQKFSGLEQKYSQLKKDYQYLQKQYDDLEHRLELTKMDQQLNERRFRLLNGDNFA